MENEKLYEAIKTLQEHCKANGGSKFPDRDKCKGCVFQHLDQFKGGTTWYCMLNRPLEWRVEFPKRWTETDLMWARAAKASGAVAIKRFHHESRCSVVYQNTTCTSLRENLFVSIKPGEEVAIDEILKEDQA